MKESIEFGHMITKMVLQDAKETLEVEVQRSIEKMRDRGKNFDIDVRNAVEKATEGNRADFEAFLRSEESSLQATLRRAKDDISKTCRTELTKILREMLPPLIRKEMAQVTVSLGPKRRKKK